MFNKLGYAQVCLTLMTRSDVDMTKIEDIMCDDGDNMAAPEEVKLLGMEHVIKPSKRIGKNLDRCLELLEKVGPVNHIVREGENNQRLLFRCKLCTTKQQPMGKVNLLGEPIYEKMVHFLGQHIKSRTHQKKLAAITADKQDGNKGGDLPDDQNRDSEENPEPEEPGPETEEAQLSCQGYCVTSPRSGGTLCNYPEEFKLWVTYNNSFHHTWTKHEYRADFTAGHWYVRHNDCQEEDLLPGFSHCRMCKQLGDPKRVVRNVLRFIMKYHAALLLNKRLFSADEEATIYAEEVMQSRYGLRHRVQWEKMCALKPADLQNFVRSSWMSIPAQEMSKNSKLFISAYVQPTLRVNATSINSQMKALFSGFVQALAKQNMTVSWHKLLGINGY